MAASVAVRKLLRKGQHHWIWSTVQGDEHVLTALYRSMARINAQIEDQQRQGYLAPGAKLTFRIEVTL